MNATLGVIGLILAFVFILARMPIAFAFGLVGFAGLWYLRGFHAACVSVATLPFSYMDSYVWTTIPMYLLMGYLAMQSRLTDEFFAGVRGWFGRRRGGLLHAIIVGNAAFGACCGVSIAAATAFTSLSLPETRKYGYDDGLALGTVCGSANLSIMIPPSFAFVLFGAITGTSISRLFIGGILPGVVMIVTLMVTVLLILWRKPELAPGGVATSMRQKARGTLGMWVLVVVFVVIIGGMYLGLFTPVEAAGVATFIILVIGLVRRRLTWAGIKYSLMETMLTSAMVFFLVIGCAVFNTFLAVSGASGLLADLLSGFTNSGTVYMLVLSGVFLILGAFLDVGALTVLFLPILFPIALKLGINPVHFAVQQTMIMNVGTVSPPFGIVVYAVAGTVPDVSMMKIFRGTLPFMLAMIILSLMLIWLPDLSTWLPSMMMGN
jgi:C4-dicarboxylate transporter DctM subunit